MADSLHLSMSWLSPIPCSPSAVVKVDSSHGLSVTRRRCQIHGFNCPVVETAEYIMTIRIENTTSQWIVFIDGSQLPQRFQFRHSGQESAVYVASLFKRQPLSGGAGFTLAHSTSSCTFVPLPDESADSESYRAQTRLMSSHPHQLRISAWQPTWHQAAVRWRSLSVNPQQWLVSLTRLADKKSSSTTYYFLIDGEKSAMHFPLKLAAGAEYEIGVCGLQRQSTSIYWTSVEGATEFRAGM
jgi:hypothetical protein